MQSVMIALLLGAVIFGGIQFHQGRKLRTELADLGKERDGLLDRIRRLKGANQEFPAGPGLASEPPQAIAAEGPAERKSAALADVGTVAIVNRPERPEGGRLNAMMNSPEVQQLMAMQQKAGLDGRYAALFKRLNLSPGELEQFKNLLVEKQSAVMDVFAAARSQGLGGRDNRDEIRQLVQDTQAEIDESIRSAIGEAAYAQYKGYETTLPHRGVVDQLGQRLSYSTTPLSEIQADQLVQILAATAPVGNAGARNQVTTPMIAAFPRSGAGTMGLGGGARITDEAVAQSQGVLSGPQLAALQSLQQEQQAAAQLMEQMRANRQNRQGGAQPPPGPGGE